MALKDNKSTLGLDTGGDIKSINRPDITSKTPKLNPKPSNPKGFGDDLGLDDYNPNKIPATPTKVKRNLNAINKTPEKQIFNIDTPNKIKSKKTPVIPKKLQGSNLLNFSLPEIKKRNLGQSVHLRNGQMFAGYSRLDLIGDSESDFNKVKPKSAKSLKVNFGNTSKKQTANLKKVNNKKLIREPKTLNTSAEIGKNNLTSNQPLQKLVSGKNNLTSNQSLQKLVSGKNNLTSNFNKIKPSIGQNNLTSNFNKIKPSVGQNNLASSFNKPKTKFGKNNLKSNIDTPIKYKP